MSESIPLSVPDLAFWALALGFAAVSALLYGAFSIMQQSRKAPAWESLSAGWLALAVPLAILWAVLFLMTIAAALLGTWKAIHDPAATTLGLGGLIAALLGAPFVIWGTVLKYQTVRYQKEGHMTDRLAKAVEQLGAEKTAKGQLVNSAGKKVFKKGRDGKPDYSRPVTVEETVPNLEVRMGAILSLERIAQDSTTHDRGRDHVMVMQILCEYIRENSNARKPRDFPLADWKPLKDDATPEERAAHAEWRRVRLDWFDPLARQWAKSLPKPRADVQLALKVIGRRSARQRLVEAAWPNPRDQTTRWPFDPDFPRLADEPGEVAMTPERIEAFMAGLEAWKKTCTDYRGYRLDLRGANLQGADLSARSPDGADGVYSGARLEGACLEGADFSFARIEGTNLGNARMAGANLHQTRMDGASLQQSRMEGAFFFGARMERADLNETRMEGATLGNAWITGADLSGARMEGAILSGAWMTGANLNDARMEGAVLTAAQAQRARFSKAWLQGASLVMARLEGADFSEARMERANLSGAKIDETTFFTDPPAGYVVRHHPTAFPPPDP